MKDLQDKVGMVLDELSGQIISFVNQGQFDNANFFMEQYIKLSPVSVDRYSLEALIRAGETDWDRAVEVLKEGISQHPFSFDLLYNLGYIHEEQEDFFEAYHIYMRARYVADTESEKSDIAAALKGLGDIFAGTIKSEDEEISTIVKAGDVQVRVRSKREEMLRRKKLLKSIEGYIGRDLVSVLEIGFEDGIISKNLNYFGYALTAVERDKTKIINAIVKEWHDNVLQPEQKVAQFHCEDVSLEWMGKIPEFDVIIAVAKGNLKKFAGDREKEEDLLKLLIEKSKKQLFIRVSSEVRDGEFSKEGLVKLARLHNVDLQTIARVDEEGDEFQLCLLSKEADMEYFSIPRGLEAIESKSTVFQVDLDKCRDMYAAGYLDDGHHFVELLKEYEENPDLDYNDSTLKSYYDNFQPQNLEEALFRERGQAAKLRRGWIGYPWYWDRSQRLVFSQKVGETRTGGNHHFGPNSEEFGEAEFKRLIHLYDYLKKQGYHPELFSDGYISGYLLIIGEDYRFVISEGQHRIACLAALGYDKIPCRFTQKAEYPRTVDMKEIKKWPQVENGVYSRNLASKVFFRFFQENVGRERLARGMEGK